MTGTLTHEALLYSSDAEFVEGTEPFVREGMAAGDAAVVVTTAVNIELLRDALGAEARGVSFVDATSWYERPARTIAGYRAVLDDHLAAGARAVRVIGEVRFGAEDRRRRAWVRYESMVNTVFHDDPVHILCPYDERVLPEELLLAASHTHRIVRRGSTSAESPGYRPPEQLLADLPELPSGPPPNRAPLAALRIDDDLGRAREAIREAGATAGVNGRRLEQLVLAANEIVTNALVHGAPPVSLQVWSDGERLVCQVADNGPGVHDPLAGYKPPPAHEGPEGQMGLWIARQLCDELELLAGGRGLTVRMTLAL